MQASRQAAIHRRTLTTLGALAVLSIAIALHRSCDEFPAPPSSMAGENTEFSTSPPVEGSVPERKVDSPPATSATSEPQAPSTRDQTPAERKFRDVIQVGNFLRLPHEELLAELELASPLAELALTPPGRAIVTEEVRAAAARTDDLMVATARIARLAGTRLVSEGRGTRTKPVPELADDFMRLQINNDSVWLHKTEIPDAFATRASILLIPDDLRESVELRLAELSNRVLGGGAGK